MALQVWLPLDGTTRNLGLSNTGISGCSATVASGGKFGSCYEFNRNSCIITNEIPTFSVPASLTAWVTYSMKPDSTTIYSVSFGQSSAGTTGQQLGFGTYGAENFTIWLGGTTFSLGHMPPGFEINKWFHVAITVAVDGTCLLYIDGELVQQMGKRTSNVSAKYLAVGARPAGPPAGLYYHPGKIQDVRLYNHCLSAKEVKEIAQCCVGHWQMNPEHNWLRTNVWTLTKQSGNTYPTLPIYSDVFSVDCSQWTLEYDVRADYTVANSAKFDFYWRLNGVAGTLPSTQTAQATWTHQKVNITCNMQSIKPNEFVIRFYGTGSHGGNVGDILYFKNLKLTCTTVPMPMRETVVYDTSGLNRNLTKEGPLVTSANTARYTSSIGWTDTIAYLYNNNFVLPQDQITIAFWMRYTQDGAPTGDLRNIPIDITTSQGEMILYVRHDMYRWFFCTSSARDQINLSGTNLIPADGLWHHYVATYDGANWKIYTDGTLRNTFARAGTIAPSTKIRLGSHTSPSSYRSGANCWQSDTRIYATAFTAEEVADLYRTSMNVDSSGNISARILT